MQKRAGPFGAGLLVGGAGGAYVANSDVFDKIVDAYVGILDRQGFAAAVASLLILVLIVGFSVTVRIITTTKDKEIDRLAKERDVLLDRVLDKPGTTAPPPPPPEQST